MCVWVFQKKPSVLEPLYATVSLLYQRLDFALKSSKMTSEKGLFTIIESRFDSGLIRILAGKKHTKIKLQRLRKIRISTFGLLVHQINPL